MTEYGRWRVEPSKEGIPLVFGDGKYPHDPPRIASELESSLAAAYAGAVEALRLLWDDIREADKRFVPDDVRAKVEALLS